MLRRIRALLRNLLRRPMVEADLDAELRAYLEELTAEKIRRGMTSGAARRAALLELGGAEQVKERVRDARAGALIEQGLSDLRHGVRTLRRSPGFTAFSLATFAVAIGGVTVILSLANAVLVRPLPYPDSDRLVMVLEASAGSTTGGFTVAAPNYLDWERQHSVFEHMALYEYMTFNLSGDGDPEQVGGLRVTGGVFELLRVPPLLGRGLQPGDDASGERLVVLSHRLWQRRYAGDSAIVGRTIRLNQKPWEVIGVMPAGFAFPSPQQEVWIPIALNSEDQGRGSHSFWSVARLRAGVTLASARAQMRGIGDRLAAEYPETNTGETVNVIPMRDLWISEVEEILRALLIAVGLVLLIASANVASLLVARGVARRRELAARMALGGARGRLVRHLVTESVLLSLGGAILGFGLAGAGIRGLVAILPPGLRTVPFRDLSTVPLDLGVFGVAVAAALVAGVGAGLAPALTALPREPAEVLRESSGRGATGRRGGRLKVWLVGLEVALALMVLIGAGLLIASIRRVLGVDPGLDPHNVITMEMALPQADFYGPAERITFCADVSRAVGSLAGVAAVGAVSHVPLSGANAGRAFVVEGAPDLGPEGQPSASYGVTCPGYFKAMGVSLLAGRDFTQDDRADSDPVMIINQALAKRWFPDRDPVGLRIKLGRFDSPDRWITIVGVARDVRHWGLQSAPVAYLYAPYAQAAWPRMAVVVRTAGPPLESVRPVREALSRVARDEPISTARTMDEVIDASLGQLRFPVILFTAFGSVAVLLAGLGIFGVASQAVVQRRRELGIRLALGAGARRVRRLMVRQMMTPVLVGMGFGIGGAVAGTRLLRGLLYEITPTDPVTFGLVAAALAAVALLACLVPAARAARLDPLVVLRED